MNSFYKKTDKYYVGLCMIAYISIPWQMIYGLNKFGVYSQETIMVLLGYPLIVVYIVYQMFDLGCSFEITQKIVKIRFLQKVLAIDTIDNVLFYDAGLNMAGSCNVFIELGGKFYNMHIKKDDYIRFKFFAKNNNIEFLGEEEYREKHKKSIF